MYSTVLLVFSAHSSATALRPTPIITNKIRIASKPDGFTKNDLKQAKLRKDNQTSKKSDGNSSERIIQTVHGENSSHTRNKPL